MTEVEPVHVSVDVEVTAEGAFEAFTRDIGSWWPLHTHSIQDDVRDAGFEPFVGGRIYEIAADGAEAEWGIVTVWDPPRRVVFTWHPNPERARETEVEVTFAESAGLTRVRLEHRGWERLAEGDRAARDSYELNWPRVLKLLAEHARGLPRR